MGLAPEITLISLGCIGFGIVICAMECCHNSEDRRRSTRDKISINDGIKPNETSNLISKI